MLLQPTWRNQSQTRAMSHNTPILEIGITPLPSAAPSAFTDRPYSIAFRVVNTEFSRQPVVTEDPSDYIDPEAQLANVRIYNWIHPLGDLVTSLIASGLTLDWLHEHDAVPWQMFEAVVNDGSGLYRWP